MCGFVTPAVYEGGKTIFTTKDAEDTKAGFECPLCPLRPSWSKEDATCPDTRPVTVSCVFHLVLALVQDCALLADASWAQSIARQIHTRAVIGSPLEPLLDDQGGL